MRIGILSRNPALYSTRRLAQVARERGHQAQVIDTTSVAVHLGRQGAPPGETHLLTEGIPGLANTSPLPALDAIIPRIGTSVTFYGLAVVRQFEAAGLITTASSQAIARSRDKLQSLQLMAQARLPIPRTAVIARPEALYAAVDAVGGLPAVVKLIHGTQGRGVLLAHYLATVAAVLQRAEELNRQAIIQEFIAEAAGRDLRVIVVGHRWVAAMERRAPQGEFRANLHQGGTAVPVELDAATAALAVRAARAHGLAVAGVDLIPSRRGPLLLEVNSSPGLEGIEATTGVDVAGAIVRYVEEAARRR
ncbi:RimK family alpha-L-glutamate ligase [Promineifilum sp.]|uniref:ATP-grasp domain-containing protein n=1 Tax=Promineifilum sp. TaxID=2664178 RepID=UPI0035AE326D